MALSLGKVNVDSKTYVIGDRVEVITDFTCDASYTTGGYSITPAQLGLSSIDHIGASVQGAPVATVSSFSYDYVNQKLKAITAAAEVANTTDLHTVVGRLVAKGKGFPSYSNP